MKEGAFNYGQCDYKTKKKATIKKHISTNHEDYLCKECNEKLPSFMKLLNHKAKHHHEETVEKTGLKDLDKNDTEKDKEVVLSESMLDNVLLEGY